MSLDFEKYVGKGVIGDLSCRSAFYQWCKLKNKKWNIFTRSTRVKNRSKGQHHAHEYTLRIPGAARRPGARLKNDA